MLKGYYKLRGWNEQSGQLKPEPLSSLGMDDIVAQLRGYKG